MELKIFEERRYNKIFNTIERLKNLNSDFAKMQETLMKSNDYILQQELLKIYEELEECYTQLSSCFYKSFDLLEQLSARIWNLQDKYKLYTKYGQLKMENDMLIGIKTTVELEELRNMLKSQFPMYIVLIDSVYDYQIKDTYLIEEYITQKKLEIQKLDKKK